MAIEIGLTSYRVRTSNGVRFIVGYDSANARYGCTRFVESTGNQLPFHDGENIRPIASSGGEAIPGFDIAADGLMIVDISTDTDGNADRYISRDAGYTWTLVNT